MCLTGGYALAAVADATGRVVAPVVSEPSLPFPLGSRRCAALHLSPQDQERLQQRLTREDLTVLGFRFHGDRISPAARFETLRQRLGDRFEGHQLPGNAHSVLTLDLQESKHDPTYHALTRVLAFLTERLATGTSPDPDDVERPLSAENAQDAQDAPPEPSGDAVPPLRGSNVA